MFPVILCFPYDNCCCEVLQLKWNLPTVRKFVTKVGKKWGKRKTAQRTMASLTTALRAAEGLPAEMTEWAAGGVGTEVLSKLDEAAAALVAAAAAGVWHLIFSAKPHAAARCLRVVGPACLPRRHDWRQEAADDPCVGCEAVMGRARGAD